MFTRILWGVFLLTAATETRADDHEHGSSVFHAFTLQAEAGAGHDNSIEHWDLDGWIGGDDNKLWIKSTGEKVSASTETSELWALYSHNVDTFWDAQAGLRYDDKPQSTTYVVIGVNGLAPYFFDTQAHLFISDEGHVSVRLREEVDCLITQQLILKPYGEVNFLPGTTEGEIGFQLRYEITRKFSPYFDLRHTRDAGGEDLIAALGLQLLF